jgi:hypothetical protein
MHRPTAGPIHEVGPETNPRGRRLGQNLLFADVCSFFPFLCICTISQAARSPENPRLITGFRDLYRKVLLSQERSYSSSPSLVIDGRRTSSWSRTLRCDFCPGCPRGFRLCYEIGPSRELEQDPNQGSLRDCFHLRGIFCHNFLLKFLPWYWMHTGRKVRLLKPSVGILDDETQLTVLAVWR